MFHEIRRLGSSYCFDRSKEKLTRATPVIPTIARDLSERDPQMRYTLSNAIAQDSALITSDDLLEQFRRLIVEPADQLAISGPIVIVIDALDECDACERSSLLSVLKNEEQQKALPPNFRILVTCRPEHDIMNGLGKAACVNAKSMTDVDESTNRSDIDVYVCDRLPQSLFEAWDLPVLRTKIVDSSEGLFQWAATACRFLVDDTVELPVKQRMDILSGEAARNLDELYSQVLQSAFRSVYPQARDNFRRVMSLVLVAAEPLSVNALQHILCRNDGLDHEVLGSVLKRMGALMSGTDGTDIVVRPLHTSFRDFILDRKRSGEFSVAPGIEQHGDFARGTLQMLSERLRINMCKLETSYRLNTDYPDLEERVRKNIPSSLVYSARYWADHLEEMAYNSALLQMAERLLKDKFLFWLEVLSLLGSVSTCASALLKLKEWIPKDTAEGPETVSIIEDFLKFIRAFGVVIGSSAPHIYLSAVPFAPARSQVRQLYESKLPRTATVVCGGSSEWPTLECTMDGDDNVLCAEFSDDGKHIFFVSLGSSCCTIHIVMSALPPSPQRETS
ncbi:hypothetical protein PUNSTDRAFT_139726 [Punctularia strigosozonata HHB-11173 SS5]|uniref:Nephrocystin 3-like N-terminal domain-containing protein n=1 Tax=Punctularia strigosozonata (strain HHB-11173) TaxID=741275 RepID=R7RZ54_PUNST|nr:uncharacterized protein PUNSTDRAFT_139726 [Punctularia strigosozonata HHB-11173 SS5]EIN03253.1 hypothetical protein PUNSTDRAFT_139726 [Punctularia strigosozonata HHB-11173 SS5]